MNSIIIALNQLKMVFSKKMAYLKFIIFPILSIYFLIGLGTSSNTSSVKVLIQNEDRTEVSQMYIEELKEKNNIIDMSERLDINSEKEIKDALIGGVIKMTMEIPEDFGERILAGEASVIRIRTLNGSEYSAWIKVTSGDIISNMRAIGVESGGDIEKFKESYEAFMAQKITLQSSTMDYNGERVTMATMAFGIFLMFMMYNALSTTRNMMNDKYRMTYHRICTTPTAPHEYIIGNLIFSIIIVVIQIIAATAILFTVKKGAVAGSPVTFIIVLVAFGLFAISLGMVLVAYNNGRMDLGSLIVTISCMLGGCYFPYAIMPKIMKNVSYLTPQRWALMALEKVQNGEGLMEVINNVGVLLGFAAIFFLVAAFKGKAQKTISSTR